jgi:hypothetical protein
MHTPHEDAPGAVVGDGAAPGAPDGLRAVQGLGVKICGRADVDVFSIRHPADVLHVVSDEFATFLAKAKAGEYDHLVPGELKDQQ